MLGFKLIHDSERSRRKNSQTHRVQGAYIPVYRYMGYLTRQSGQDPEIYSSSIHCHGTQWIDMDNLPGNHISLVVGSMARFMAYIRNFSISYVK